MEQLPIRTEKVYGRTRLFAIVASITLCIILNTPTFGQIAINSDGSDPNAKAMLDVSSSTMGILIPRMKTNQRETFEATLTSGEKGMLVYDTQIAAVFYFNGSQFEKLSNGAIALIQDSDGDTKIDVESSPDCDIVTIEIDGVQKYTFEADRIGMYNSNNNIALGNDALNSNNKKYNIAIGDSVLHNNGNGYPNSLESIHNIGVGAFALMSNTLGYENTAIGIATLRNNTEGSENIAIGPYSLFHNFSGYKNTALGAYSLYSNTFGGYNTALGYSVLHQLTSAGCNTGVGSYSLYKTTSGYSNSAFGTFSLHDNSTGKNNTAIGSSSLYHNTSGYSNVAVGVDALYRSTIQSNNVAIGDSALYNNGNGVTILGYGEENTAVGSKSLYSNTSGWHNVAIGCNSLYFNTEGSKNTAIGSDAIEDNTTGVSNSALGTMALSSNTTGSYSTAVGSMALRNNSSGHYNCAFGHYALFSNSIGIGNTAIGSYSLGSITTGNNNIAMGYGSGDILSTGSNNIYIGYHVSAGASDESNTLNIGNYIFGTGFDGSASNISNGNVGIGVRDPETHLDVEKSMKVVNTSGSAKIYIDGSLGTNSIVFRKEGITDAVIGYSTFSDYLYISLSGEIIYFNDGKIGIGYATPNQALQVGSSSSNDKGISSGWLTFSDKTQAKDLINITNPLEKLNKISGYYYFGKDTEDKSRQVGIIAQEVEEVLPEIVSTDEEGYKAVDYSKLTPLLIEVCKEQQKQIEMLEQRIEALEK